MKTLKWFPRLFCASMVAISLSATAQTWPTKPIKLITSAAPGGVVDIYARRHQPHLQNELGQAVMVENKPGASGAIAGDAAAKADADGHTLFMGSQNELGLIGQLGVPVRYDPAKDFSTVGLTIAGYPILMVNAQLGVKNVAELVAYIKAKNTTLDCGGSGTATHFGVGTASSGVGKLLYKGTVTPNISVSSGVTPELSTSTAITED